MTERCDGCGRPVGHADEIVAEYVEKDGLFVFGSRECKDIFEDEQGVEPASTCDNCREPVKDKNAVKVTWTNSSGYKLGTEVHPDCEEDFLESKNSQKSEVDN